MSLEKEAVVYWPHHLEVEEMRPIWLPPEKLAELQDEYNRTRRRALLALASWKRR